VPAVAEQGSDPDLGADAQEREQAERHHQPLHPDHEPHGDRQQQRQDDQCNAQADVKPAAVLADLSGLRRRLPNFVGDGGGRDVGHVKVGLVLQRDQEPHAEAQRDQEEDRAEEPESPGREAGARQRGVAIERAGNAQVVGDAAGSGGRRHGSGGLDDRRGGHRSRGRIDRRRRRRRQIREFLLGLHVPLHSVEQE